MPVLPYLTDTVEHLDRALEAIRKAGGASVTYGALHLRPGAREWFLAWIDREHPGLSGRYRALYRSSSYAPDGYRRWLGERMRVLMRRHGFGARPSRLRRELGSVPALQLAPQPTLF